MRAEIISIGDEMTSGQRLDTNSQWLSQRLDEMGILVAFHVTVGDTLEDNVRVFREALSRSDLVVMSGGLGPTADDLTRDALAQLLQVDLELNEGVLLQIEAMFSRRNRSMPPRNRVQAMFPHGTEVIDNPNGTAPGILVKTPGENGPGKLLFALPGVPVEMKEMWSQSVAPAIRQQWPELPTLRRRCIKCFGVGESELEARLPDMIRRGRNPLVGITVSQATISLRLVASGSDVADCDAGLDRTEAEIEQCLGVLIFGRNEDELQHAIHAQLVKRQATLCTVEGGTAGYLANCFSEPEVNSQYLGGIVSPDPIKWPSLINELETLAPATDPDTQQQLAKALAESARRQTGATYAIAIGSFLRNAEGGYNSVAIAVATPQETLARTSLLMGHPDILVPRTAKQAMNELRLWLIRQQDK